MELDVIEQVSVVETIRRSLIQMLALIVAVVKGIFVGFLQYPQAYWGSTFIQIGHDNLLSHPCLITVDHPSFCFVAMCSCLDTYK